MKLSYRIAAWIASFLVGALSIIVATQLNASDRTLINYVTIFGTALSFIGLILTFIQVRSVKETSELTKQEVTSTIEKLNLILTVSDVSKASQIIEIVQGYLRDNKFELAYFKMKDLKGFLIQIKHLKDLPSYIEINQFDQSLQNFNIDLTSINTSITNVGKSINRNAIINNLENLSTILSTLTNTVKYKEMYGN